MIENGPPNGDIGACKLFSGSCAFAFAAMAPENLPPQSLNEFAFLGRSNCGKSSLINALTQRKALARVSQTPGATRQINFYNLSNRLFLVDLPGYGFSRRSKKEGDAWQRLVLSYLRERASLRRVALLIDARRGPMQNDVAVMELMDRLAISYGLVLTKLDKIAVREREAVWEAARQEAKRHSAALEEVQLTSALSGEGIAQLRSHIAALSEFKVGK